MKSLKSVSAAGTAIPLTLMLGPAFAADMAVKAPAAAPPPYNWTGLYIGLNAGGYAAYSGDPSTTTTCAGALAYFYCSDVPGVNAAGTGSMSGAGFTGGGQIGYNWQSGHAVFGVESDFDSFNTRISRQVTAPYANGSYSGGGNFTIASSANTTWLFTARGRFGWAFDTLLVYGTGGLAVTNLGASNRFNDGLASGAWSTSADKTGWTAGAGLEWAFTKNWTAKIEYLYVQFGSVTAAGAVSGGGYSSAISTTTDLSAQIARGGVNYKF